MHKGTLHKEGATGPQSWLESKVATKHTWAHLVQSVVVYKHFKALSDRPALHFESQEHCLRVYSTQNIQKW